MGVRGLLTYMTSHQLGENVKLEYAAEQYRKETGKQPVLLIDISSCLSHMHNKHSSALAAQLKPFKKKCEEFADRLHGLDIRLISVADGMKPKDKLQSWVFRNNAYVANTLNGVPDDRFRKCLFAVALDVFATSDKCEFHRALYEADDYIAHYLKEFQAFGVLTNDSDFVLMDGSQYCFWIERFDFSDMGTFNFNKYKLGRHLNINPKSLPLVGTLCPNHILRNEDLKGFHRQHRVPAVDKFKSVAEVVRRHLPDDPGRLLDELQSYQCVLRLDNRRLKKFRERLRSLTGESGPEELRLTGNKNWDDILALAKNMHVKGLADRRLLEVLVEKVYFCSVGFADVTMASPDEKLESLRRKMYGFLFYEHPEEVSVTEHLYALTESSEMVKYCCRQVTFARRDHLGLLKLWSSDPSEDVQKQKYQFFFEIINEKLDPSTLVGKTREEFVFPLLAVFILHHELKKFEAFQLDVLLIQSILADKSSADEVEKLEGKDPLPDALNLCDWYVKVIEHLELLNNICGYPFSRKKTSVINHLEGLILQGAYERMMSNAKAEEYLSPQVFATFRHLKDVLDAMKMSCGS